MEPYYEPTLGKLANSFKSFENFLAFYWQLYLIYVWFVGSDMQKSYNEYQPPNMILDSVALEPSASVFAIEDPSESRERKARK